MKMVISFFLKARLKMTALLNNKKEVRRLPFMLFQLNYFDALPGIGSHHG